MSGEGFSADWLALREPADHVARNQAVARRVTAFFEGRDSVRLVDLGCGAGSNLRGTAPLLPMRQHWTLVDHDPALLAAAETALTTWADRARRESGVLHLAKGAHEIAVVFRPADLSGGADEVLLPGVDLVTAAALFDLCGGAWLARFAAALAARRLPLYTVLTYDGRDRFEPPHPADAAMLAAFHADMRRDKGFGPAEGPEAASALVAALRDAGYRVETGDSPWVLDPQSPLAQELARGFAAAVVAAGRVSAAEAQAWVAARRAGRLWETGHTDVFAAPA
jgi:hypothetical protein